MSVLDEVTIRAWASVGGEQSASKDAVYDAWVEALRDAWHLARGERLGELRGRRQKLLDERGMHPYSLAWGRAMACEQLLPELQSARLADPPVDPVLMRRLAQRDAEQSFESELREHGSEVWH
jgi:hypothetical protein